MPTQLYHSSQYNLSEQGEQSIEKNIVQRSDTVKEHGSAVVKSLLDNRFSCRYFLPDRIPDQKTIESILLSAKNSPSGSNFQPWHVHVLRGTRKDEIRDHVHKAANDADAMQQYQAPYTFYPSNATLARPEYQFLAQRRSGFGERFYGPLNIDRKDTKARRELSQRNWSFFDAPIGFIITTIPEAPPGMYLDTGMFIMALILAIRSYGLECCIQEAHATYHDVYANQLQLPNTESVVCGIALGYPDLQKIQQFSGKQEKMSLDELVTYH
ncbi:Nitroreductase [Meira miltonrushii]|uniref:Nitroreductase n=1 Tax=Meira miltonrushii TaxID=1280837 RepID=A0A316V5C4_9BASI|nr:Nitroreductase [Meira miltonrushii]PWN31423.1 Nitroreductase [Meira miltonrushii]